MKVSRPLTLLALTALALTSCVKPAQIVSDEQVPSLDSKTFYEEFLGERDKSPNSNSPDDSDCYKTYFSQNASIRSIRQKKLDGCLNLEGEVTDATYRLCVSIVEGNSKIYLERARKDLADCRVSGE